MHTRAIPSTGEMLPVIGLGTWQTFDVEPSHYPGLAEVLSEFVRTGGKLVDSSPMYGRSEAVVGALAKQLGLHDRLFLATKVWTTGKAAGVEQMQTSAARLGTTPVDLMQVHNLVDMDVHLRTLSEWKRERRVRYVGITHYTASAYDAVEQALKAHAVDFLQINYSVAEREAEKRLLPLAHERGVAVIANRPFGGGLLGRLARRPLPHWAGELECTSWAQLLLKFILGHPAVVCAIPATSQVQHLRDNMQAGLGAMPDESLRARIRAAAYSN
jgi:diketogulonate reductase-like aldo/keto reductase